MQSDSDSKEREIVVFGGGEEREGREREEGGRRDERSTHDACLLLKKLVSNDSLSRANLPAA